MLAYGAGWEDVSFKRLRTLTEIYSASYKIAGAPSILLPLLVAHAFLLSSSQADMESLKGKGQMTDDS
jgi:hypothetical protein